MKRTCSAPGCDRAAAGRFCSAHRKRLQRGRPLAPPVRQRAPDAFAAFLEAAIALADASDEDDLAYHRAVQQVRSAGESWLAPLLESRRDACSRDKQDCPRLGVGLRSIGGEDGEAQRGT
jgi:hypothetical protein